MQTLDFVNDTLRNFIVINFIKKTYILKAMASYFQIHYHQFIDEINLLFNENTKCNQLKISLLPSSSFLGYD